MNYRCNSINGNRSVSAIRDDIDISHGHKATSITLIRNMSVSSIIKTSWYHNNFKKNPYQPSTDVMPRADFSGLNCGFVLRRIGYK